MSQYTGRKRMMFRVAVIGGGVSGLAAIKTCLEEGFEPVCFEKEAFFGGTWTFREKDRSLNSPRIYEGMLINVCKEMMAYSDFPFPDDAPPFIKGTDVIKYYRDYAAHFELEKYIQFNTEVLQIEQAEDYDSTGRWLVHTREQKEGHVVTTEFDAVMVCSGLYSKAFIPSFPGLDDFPGEVVHSCQFRRGSEFKGKRVVVVGACQSAGDLCVLCCDHAEKLYMSVRHGAWVLPRVVNKEPQDAHANKRWKTWIPECLQKVLLKNACMSLLDYRGLGLLSTRHPYNSSVMINDTLPMKVMSGAVKVKGQIQRFDGSTVVFDDGSRAEEVDCVIFATGFQFEATFIDNNIIADDLGKLELFMHVLPPRLKHRTLTVIGFVECRGGTGPMAELQARWSTQLFKGNIALPSLETMLADIQTTRDQGYKRYQLFRPRASTVEYQDMLAKSMNALPSFLDLVFCDPVLALHHYFGPALPQSYRLVGPHAQKNARERVIESARRLMHGITLSTVRRLADPKCKSVNSRGGGEWDCRFNVDGGMLDRLLGGPGFLFCSGCALICCSLLIASLM